jgi:hypothetical protein
VAGIVATPKDGTKPQLIGQKENSKKADNERSDRKVHWD